MDKKHSRPHDLLFPSPKPSPITLSLLAVSNPYGNHMYLTQNCQTGLDWANYTRATRGPDLTQPLETWGTSQPVKQAPFHSLNFALSIFLPLLHLKKTLPNP